jgi:hypothetical protein
LPQNKGKKQKIGVCHMLRDVLVASLNKGQFLVALSALLLALLIFKMSSEDVGKLVFRLLSAAEARFLVGYAMAGVLLACWFLHSKYQRRQFTRELERLCEERNRLQSHALGKRLKSSEASR